MNTPDREPTVYIGVVTSVETRGEIISFKVAIPEEMRHPEYVFDKDGYFPGIALIGDSTLDELTVGSVIKIFDDNKRNDSFSQIGARWRFEKIVD